MRLKGKKAVVTGAVNPRGIGFGVATVFAREGADLVISYRHDAQEDVEAALKALRAYGVKAEAVYADITSDTDVKRLMETAEAYLGGLDILVNNAGACVWETLDQITPHGMELMAKVNLLGTLRCSREAASRMREKKTEGRIINISSCNARRPNPGMGGYGAMKAGMDLMSQSMAMELAPLRITVNQVWPGYVVTDINKGQPGGLTEEGIRQSMKTIPVGVMATPEDIGEAALFFAEEKNRTVTGAAIKVDGGAFIRCLQ